MTTENMKIERPTADQIRERFKAEVARISARGGQTTSAIDAEARQALRTEVHGMLHVSNPTDTTSGFLAQRDYQADLWKETDRLIALAFAAPPPPAAAPPVPSTPLAGHGQRAIKP